MQAKRELFHNSVVNPKRRIQKENTNTINNRTEYPEFVVFPFQASDTPKGKQEILLREDTMHKINRHFLVFLLAILFLALPIFAHSAAHTEKPELAKWPEPLSGKQIKVRFSAFSFGVPAGNNLVAADDGMLVIAWKNGQGLVFSRFAREDLPTYLRNVPDIDLRLLPGHVFRATPTAAKSALTELIEVLRNYYFEKADVAAHSRKKGIHIYYTRNPANGFAGSAMVVLENGKGANQFVQVDAKNMAFEQFLAILGTTSSHLE